MEACNQRPSAETGLIDIPGPSRRGWEAGGGEGVAYGGKGEEGRERGTCGGRGRGVRGEESGADGGEKRLKEGERA